MGRAIDTRDLVVAAWKTWGARGLARRAAYEASRRSSGLHRAEQRWLDRLGSAPPPLTRTPITPLTPVSPPPPGEIGVELYGGLDLDTSIPPDWHRHPITGHRYPTRHWSEISDADTAAGDIKDVWEPARLGWCYPALRRWSATGDESSAELIWEVIEDLVAANPPYRGPHWMCGQETSLRAISAMFLTFAIDSSAHTTTERRETVARLVATSAGRVRPTLGYAMSQRNNHAISEAGFLWTAAVLAPQLPDALDTRTAAARSLTEAVADQFGADGSYAQLSPTYQRLALHVLLWCLLVARSTGENPPDGVAEAVGDSVGFLRSLVAPASDGRVPNLGGNDGAHLFPLAPGDIGDLRPVLAHAAAATGQSSGFGPGPWDEEASWFGLHPSHEPVTRRDRLTVNSHALTRGTTHLVLRAGPVQGRPAHADQLHADVWIDGEAVAVDPGSYRYTAAPPWDNALSADVVHNLPTRPSVPQAVRRGRFFWQRWSEAEVLLRISDTDVAAMVAELELSDRTLLRRLVAVADGTVVVADHATAPARVRWNLARNTSVDVGQHESTAHGNGWEGRFLHGSGASVPTPSDDDPESGWHAPTYGVRQPLTPLLLGSDEHGWVLSTFRTPQARPLDLHPLRGLDLSSPDPDDVRAALTDR